MTVTILSGLVFIAALTGVEKRLIINQTQLIEVPEGSNLTLQCRTNTTINLMKVTVFWKRIDVSSVSDRVVFSRRGGTDHPVPQMERYRNRTELIKEDLIKGWMTLRIIRVQESDSGLYRCFIPKNTSFVFNIVVKKDQEMRTKREDLTTTTSPVYGAMSPGVTDAAEERIYWFIAVPVLLLLLLLVVVVVKLRKSGMCKKSRRRADEENQHEMKNLRTGDEDEEDGGKDEDVPAASVLRDVQHG